MKRQHTVTLKGNNLSETVPLERNETLRESTLAILKRGYNKEIDYIESVKLITAKCESPEELWIVATFVQSLQL